MPTPADHNPIESQLADLQPGLAGPDSAPEAFLAGVRARRTRTIMTRSAVGVATAGVVAVVAAVTIRPTGPAPDLSPLARDTDSPSPATLDQKSFPVRSGTTLASFRKLYAADESFDDLLDSLPTVPSRPGDPVAFRLGDRDARWAEGL